MRGLGWVEGQNLVIEYRFGGEDYERLRALAADLVRLKVDVIFAATAPSAQAAKDATTSIPIVFHTLNDPVRGGLVASFGRPGGNLTGNAGLGPELDRKRIELLKELVPSLSRATVLVNPTNIMTRPRLGGIDEVARTLRIQVRVVEASDTKGLDGALQAMARSIPAGLIIFEDPLFSVTRPRIIEFAARHRIPTVYTQSGWAEEEASSSTPRTSSRWSDRRPDTSTVSSVVHGLPIFQLSSRRSSSSSSTSRRPRPSASRSPRRSCCGRIR